MSQTEAASRRNGIIAALPARDRKRFLAECTPVELLFAEVLNEPGERIRHVYFPQGSFVSLVAEVDPRSRIEVGMVGDEGMLGVSVVLESDIAPLHAVVQGPGPALRMNIAPFRRQLAKSPALVRLLKRYLYMTLGQLAQTAACNRFHVVEARLARWLLMTQDRSHSSVFYLTHDFLSYMLGVRRVGVTRAASALQRAKLIHYRRGNIAILDRQGLESHACACYAADALRYRASSP